MKRTYLLLLIISSAFAAMAQVNYTAKDTVLPYNDFFRAGTNLGFYPGFSDEFLAEIAAGHPAIGVEGLSIKALRPGLFESFLYEYGYDARLDTYALWDSLGLKDNTMIVGFPAAVHQDPTEYCPGIQSTLFANMYEPIWDGGANGTPINEENHYALYIYNLVTMYGEYIKFWEIWNEPGFDFTENRGWLPPGEPGNWWENNPDPCDYKLRAPIFHYVRLLRISYDVIKTIDPEAYVAVSGVGYPSFLDAILRNTDNPNDGSISTAYPNKGGAYFDVMGFHSYPHFDGSLRYWDNDLMDFVLTRHSDAAADGVLELQDTLQGVLDNYGYDGATYPEKPWIITEINLPRKEFGDYIGSAESQRNFMIKHIVFCMQNNFLQSHIFKLAEDKTYDDAFFEFDLMGLYKKLDLTDGYFQAPNDEGIAYKTVSELLYGTVHDQERTNALNLPEGVRGGAFRDVYNNYTYVLWAETSIDNSELASAVYSFPGGLGLDQLIQRSWDFGSTGIRTMIGAQNIQLSGAPIFLTDVVFEMDITEGCAPQTIQFTDQSPSNAVSWMWTFENGNPESSTAQNPNVTFGQVGSFEVTLQSFDINGNLLAAQSDVINIDIAPQADFSFTVNGGLVDFSNSSTTNTDQFLWDFGDGNTSSDPSPNHLYLQSGTFEAVLTASNLCGTSTQSVSIDIVAPSTSMLTFTANDQVPIYENNFRPGSNTDYYPLWSDEELGDIAAGNPNVNQAGAGVKSFRTILPHYFLEFWGYDIELGTFEYYNNIDLRDNVATIGFPSSDVVDTVAHCPDENSILFANLYLDIWDGGANGTPINDDNEFARYLYHTVNTYKDHIRFWEILSGPDFDASGERGWLPPGEDGNWWENDPDPCDCAIHAPVQYYVRMLRISYEVIKTLDEDAYVTIAGIGFPSFLDAVLRNTDNPIDGSIVDGFPLKGGAYFDAVAYNSLPHFDGSTIYYDVDVGGFVYERHSDAAANGIVNLKNEFQDVLNDYSYDGITYPEKQWYISGCNIPRKQLGDYIGGESAHRNFIIKAYINSIKNNILQFHVRQLAESASWTDATDPFEVMGLYQYLDNANPYNQNINHQGIAYKTVSDLLFATTYDADRTALLALPEEIDGAAFYDANGDYTYVLWAKTWIDMAETANATYSLPGSLGLTQVYKKQWNWSYTPDEVIIPSTDIELTGAPIFLTEAALPLQPPLAQFTTSLNVACPGDEVQFTDASLRATSYSWTFEGGDPSTSNLQNPGIVYNQPGLYQVKLEAINAAGSHTAIYTDYILIEADPVAGFTYQQDNTTIDFMNTSIGATSYLWDMGDGFTTLSFDPEHTYATNGIFEVQLIAFNDCGSDTTTQTVQVGSAPDADFLAVLDDGCAPYTIFYFDQSNNDPISWEWFFEGGTPATSDVEQPNVVYDIAGVYNTTLIVSNTFGSDTIYQSVEVNSEVVLELDTTLCSTDMMIINGTMYSVDQPTGIELLENAATNGCDSLVYINISNGDDIEYNSLEACDGDVFIINGEEYTVPGVYTFEYTNALGCDSVIAYEFIGNETYFIELSDTIEFGEVYQLGDSLYSQAGFYTQSYQTVLGCDSIITLQLYVDDLERVDDISNLIKLRYFPNPFDQTLNIALDLPQSTMLGIELFDTRGTKVALVKSYSLSLAGAHLFVFDQSNLPSGIYWLKISWEDAVLTKRLVKINKD